MAQVGREPRRIAQLYDLTVDYISSSVCGTDGGEQSAGMAMQVEEVLQAETRQAVEASVADEAGESEGADGERHTCNTCNVTFEHLSEQVLSKQIDTKPLLPKAMPRNG